MTGMPHRVVLQTEFIQRVVGILSDGHDPAGLEGVQQGEEQVLTGLALGSGMAAVGQGSAGFERVQGEDVPEEDGLIHSGQHLPDHGRGAFGNGQALGGAVQGKAAVGLGKGRKMFFVGQRQPGAAAAAVAKVPGDPEGIDAHANCRIEQGTQIGAAPAVRVGPVAQAASLAVRVEDSVEADAAQGLDERAGDHMFFRVSDLPLCGASLSGAYNWLADPGCSGWFKEFWHMIQVYNRAFGVSRYRARAR